MIAEEGDMPIKNVTSNNKRDKIADLATAMFGTIDQEIHNPDTVLGAIILLIQCTLAGCSDELGKAYVDLLTKALPNVLKNARQSRQTCEPQGSA